MAGLRFLFPFTGSVSEHNNKVLHLLWATYGCRTEVGAAVYFPIDFAEHPNPAQVQTDSSRDTMLSGML